MIHFITNKLTMMLFSFQMAMMNNKYQEGLRCHRKLNDQLRLEATVQRKPISECLKDHMDYCEQNSQYDKFITGFGKHGENPFTKNYRGQCLIL